MKKKYLICSFMDKFSFPLREALQKQVWWKAKEKRKEYDVSIIIFGKEQKTFAHEGIKVSFLRKNEVSAYFLRADIVNFMVSVVGPRLLMAGFVKGKKILTVHDGYPLGDNKHALRRIVVKFLPFIFDEIYVLSEFQRKVLGLKNVNKTNPLLPEIEKPNLSKYKDPTLLYMGHISYFKGVDTIIEAFRKLKSEIPNLRLIIANNMIRGDKKLMDQVNFLKSEYPEDIIIKGVVNPIEELTKAWIYIYPFKTPSGTMAFPLSLYESKCCGTPFIACDVGSNAEFFGKKNLIKPGDVDELVEKIKEILEHEYNYCIG